MKKSLGCLLAVVSACLLQVTASAQPVQIQGEPCQLPVKDVAEPVTLSEFEVFGLVSPDEVGIRYQDQNGRVDRETFQSLFPSIDLSALPDGSALLDISQTTVGDEAQVREIQDRLKRLGLYDGNVDGLYGGKTLEAVSKFQDEHRLEHTGILDVYTQMALLAEESGKLDEPIVIVTRELTPEEKFGSVIDMVSADLGRYTGYEWRFSFDPVEGIGSIDKQVKIGSHAVEEPPIDRISLSCGVKVMAVRDDAEEVINLVPAITVDSTGAYRPYIQGILLSSGDKVCRLDGAVSFGSLQGVTLTESAYVPFTEKAAEFINSNKKIKMRLIGKNNSYDLSMKNRKKVLNFLETAGADITE